MDKYFFDTSVIVHHFQRNQVAKAYMEKLFNGEAEVAISRITEVELWAGIKDTEVQRHENVSFILSSCFQTNLVLQLYHYLTCGNA